MRTYLEFLAMLPVMVICYQLYAFAARSQGEDRQRRCQKLGIVYMTIGTTCLVTREIALVFFGLVLIMTGFRAMAKGLDRLEKKVFIDRYDGPNDNPVPKPGQYDRKAVIDRNDGLINGIVPESEG